MKKRMRLLGLILAGSMTAANPVVLDASQQIGTPTAGVLSAFAGYIALEDTMQADAGRASETGQASAQADGVQANGSQADDAQTNGSQADGAQSGESAATEAAATETKTAAEEEEVPETSEYADIAIAQVNNYVNVRSEPNTESEVLGKLYNNSAATVHEEVEDGWYRISSGSVEGYVKAEYVVVGDEELAKEVGTRYATVTTTTLFVRMEPTTEAKILTMLPEGDDLVALDESVEGWIRVSTEEGEGYISGDYVALSTEYVEAESKEEEEARLAREEAERKAAAEAAEAARLAEQQKQSASSSGSSNSGKSSSTSGSKSSGSTSSSSSGSSSSSASGSASSGSISNGQAVANYAKQFLGNPYVYGGTSLTNGADCSGFVMSVYAAFGVSLPRTSAEQRSAGYEVSLSDIQPGDIICYSGHVGIYVGNDTLIHASTAKTGIIYTSPVTYRPVLSVRRIF